MKLYDQDTISIPPDGKLDQDQPKWRQDFPIDIPQDEYVSRRDFTKFMVLISAAFVVGQYWILLQNYFRRLRGQPPIKEVISIADLPIGQSHVFEYPAEHNPCILIRISDNNFVAYSQKCTHLSCPVIPEVKRSIFHCPCHEGYFEMNTGRPIAGPPRRPLPKIQLKIAGNKIYASGLEAPV